MSFLSLRTKTTRTTNTKKGFSNQSSNVTDNGYYFSIGGSNPPTVRHEDRLLLRGGSSNARGGEDIDTGIADNNFNLNPQPMQVDLANRQVGSDISRPLPNRLVNNMARGASNMARGASNIARELSSPIHGKKRQHDLRSETPKTPPTENDIGRTVLEFGEDKDLRGEVGEVDNIDNVIDAADMCMEVGSLEEDDNNNKKKAAQIRVTEHIIKNSNAIRRTPRERIAPIRLIDQLQAEIQSQQSRTRSRGGARAPRIGGGVIRGPQARATRSRAVQVRFLLSFIINNDKSLIFIFLFS